METILDFEQPVNVKAFDAVMTTLSSGQPGEIMRAQEILVEFKRRPDAFLRVDKLLTESQNTHTRFFALQVLDDTIEQRWNTLNEENQRAIRNFIMNLIVQDCTSFERVRANKVLLTKMNSTLVSIAKREWPVRWPNFIQDVCASAGPTHPMVENNLNLLRLVGEEVFQFGEKTLTSRWIERKKQALSEDFRYIMELFATVLVSSTDSYLLRTALHTFTEYVPWISPSLLFNEAVLMRVVELSVGDDVVRSAAVRCLAEVCAVRTDSGSAGDEQTRLLVRTFTACIRHIVVALPTTHSSVMERVVQLYESGSTVNQDYVSYLASLLTTFLRQYYMHISYDDSLLLVTHELLIGISNVYDKELFKSCVEYWGWLGDLMVYGRASSVKRNMMVKLNRILSDVRYVLIKRMAKPEEVVLVDDEGELRREHMADVEELHLYTLMREALFLLARFDPMDTLKIMVNLMQRQLDRSEWSWHNCNTLSWAVGAISEAMPSPFESELFVTIIKGLLQLCREMQGKENRAVIASDIMFVVGQYPQYLFNHANFLFTVARKLFEFMHETFPGVQDMAVDTFLKLTKKVATLLVKRDALGAVGVGTSSNSGGSSSSSNNTSTNHINSNHGSNHVYNGSNGDPLSSTNAVNASNSGGSGSNINNGMSELSTSGRASFAEQTAIQWTNITAALSRQQLQTCFAAVGCMVAAEVPEHQAELLGLFLRDTNVHFKRVSDRVLDSTTSTAAVTDTAWMAELLHYLRILSSVAETCGDAFIHQMNLNIQTLYALYRILSEAQRLAITQLGPAALTRQDTKYLHLCKREILRVFEQFVTHTEHREFVTTYCLPDVLTVVLLDYESSLPPAREAGVLVLVAACVRKLGSNLSGDCAAILDHTFATTVAMLGDSMETYPEFRVGLFKLLQALNHDCFDAYVTYTATHEDIIGGMLWAIKHTDHPTMITGLETLDTFLRNVAESEFAEVFYTAYIQGIFVDVLVAALDSLHAAGFALHCSILKRLFTISSMVADDMPVVGRAAVTAFLLKNLLVIPTLTETTIQSFVDMCYSTCRDDSQFNTRFADFLIEVRVWGAEEENKMQEADEQRRRQQALANGGAQVVPSMENGGQTAEINASISHISLG